ncbi:flagellar hook-associated protein FlgK [Telmatospirillum sp.]|uniref:flagellar hook-associated protein FlgK n=1 Tax=Telmatospirillum sp. TaxID=2079197 RepID=UPI00284232CB|nr:flagellar hook-associated protein FlgK [Telmatospirillum sp.]MDR3438536.1 flagellar hook-associated protein FlgK [Telmatospirillum sp.]
MSSLNVALSSAVSSLLVIEKQMGVTSNNISNANTVGYSKETVQLAPSVSGGVGTGVTDLGTTSNIDQFLLASVRQATTASSSATAYNTLYQKLQNALGSISGSETGGGDIASQLSTLETSLTKLATTPSDTALSSSVVQSLDNLTSNMRSMSTQIQSLRTTADQNISDAVTDANTQLNTINSLNKQIAVAKAQGQPTASLEDSRNTAFSSLTSDLGVNAFVNGNDIMQVYTTSGTPLLLGDGVNELSHTAVTVSSSTSYASGTINGIMVGNTDITSDITSGTIAGDIQMRDTELPNAQNSLDTLAQHLSTTLNTISNQGTANPAPSSLTSSFGNSYPATDQVTPSSTAATPPASANLVVRVAMVDSSGQVQSFKDVDLSTAATVGDVVSDINTAMGSTVASLSGSGQLVLSSTTTGQGIAVSTVSGTLGSPNSSSSATDFSSFFHLNDVISGGSSASGIAVNSTLMKNSYLFPSATLNTSSSTVPYAGIGASDGTTATNLANALLATNQTFAANTATSTTAESSATTALGLSGTFTIQGGSGPVSVTVASTDTLSSIELAINNAISAAGISGVSASLVGYGSYQLQISSGGNPLTLVNNSGNVLSSLGLSSSPSGYLGTTTTSFSGYASSIISDIAQRASSAATDETTKSTALSTLKNSLSSQSGVNTDEETAKLTELQSAYAASARIVSTVQTMFNALLTAVGG